MEFNIGLGFPEEFHSPFAVVSGNSWFELDGEYIDILDILFDVNTKMIADDPNLFEIICVLTSRSRRQRQQSRLSLHLSTKVVCRSNSELRSNTCIEVSSPKNHLYLQHEAKKILIYRYLDISYLIR